VKNLSLIFSVLVLFRGCARLPDNSNKIHEEIGASAFQLKLVDGDIQWIEKSGEKEIIHTTEPHTSFWDRTSVWLLLL
jgi:hypothetical protein